MSDEKQKDVELKKLSKELLNQQIATAEGIISSYQAEVVRLQNNIQQQLGIAAFSRHLLANFDLPEKVEAPKSLEVK